MKNKNKNNDIVIEVKNLKKTYKVGKVITPVLKGISLKIYKGEFVGIMGPSGSGKSTLLHQIALLDNENEGEIIIENKLVNNLNEEESGEFRLNKLGYVFQEYRNIPELTSIENVYLPLKMQGILGLEEYKKIAKDLLIEVGMGERLNHLPSELSGGQQQRVAIARALATKPLILFADEPTASLDVGSGDIILKLFSRFNKEYNQTIVMVTHEPEQIKYFDRVIYIKDGLIEKEVNKK